MALGLCVGVAATKRRSDVAASAAHTYTPIHMNMSYLSIILFCISDAVFRFAFFFGQLLCFFLGDFTQTHAHMHICSVSAACAAAAHSLSTLSSPSQALLLLLLLLPDVSLSLLLRFVLSHLLSCSLTDLSLGLVCQAATAVVVAALPVCFFCSCCCSFSFCSACCSFSCCCCSAAFHGCCLSYSEGAN